MAIDFARLNYILIPKTRAARAKWRRRPLARFVVFLYERLTREGRMLAATTLAMGVFALDVRRTEAHVLWVALGGTLAVSLLVGRFVRLRAVRVVVRAPPRVPVGEEITFSLTATNDGAEDHASLRFEGPFLSWDGTYTRRGARVPLLGAGASAHVEMAARFTQRGAHDLDAFRLTALVPFGLAASPSLRTGGVQFVVTPRLANVVHVALSREGRREPGGVPLVMRAGRSMQLLGTRPYRPGDPVRDLHAKSWARAGVPIIREYQTVHLLRVGVLLDTDVGPRDQDVLEAAISVAAGATLWLSRGECVVDLVATGAAVHAVDEGGAADGRAERALDVLASVEASGAFDAHALLAALERHVSRLVALCVVLTRWSPERERLLDQLRARGLTCAVILVAREPLSEPPPGVGVVTPRAVEAGEAVSL